MAGFNGSGQFVRTHDWTTDLANTVPVTASRMDAEDDGFATGLSNTICRDGQSTTTARIPFAAGASAVGGSASATAYANQNDANTGVYFPGADEIGLAAGGTAVITATATTVTVPVDADVTGDLDVAGAVMSNGTSLIPIGAMMDYWGSAAPAGWLLCHGQAVSRTTYAALFSAISTVGGVGDGSTTFNIPDCRGRVVAGQDDMGGTSANRLTNQAGGLDGDALGATGGSETHTLTDAQMASTPVTVSASQDAHEHFIGNTNQASSGTGSPLSSTTYLMRSRSGTNEYFLGGDSGGASIGLTSSATPAITASGTVQGSDQAHNNVQPTIVANKIIYTGVYS